MRVSNGDPVGMAEIDIEAALQQLTLNEKVNLLSGW